MARDNWGKHAFQVSTETPETAFVRLCRHLPQCPRGEAGEIRGLLNHRDIENPGGKSQTHSGVTLVIHGQSPNRQSPPSRGRVGATATEAESLQGRNTPSFSVPQLRNSPKARDQPNQAQQGARVSLTFRTAK